MTEQTKPELENRRWFIAVFITVIMLFPAIAIMMGMRQREAEMQCASQPAQCQPK